MQRHSCCVFHLSSIQRKCNLTVTTSKLSVTSYHADQMVFHLRRVSDLLYDWNSWLPCHMKDVVLHCSTFFKWNTIVRFRVRVPAKVHGWMARRPERLTGRYKQWQYPPRLKCIETHLNHRSILTVKPPTVSPGVLSLWLLLQRNAIKTVIYDMQRHSCCVFHLSSIQRKCNLTVTTSKLSVTSYHADQMVFHLRRVSDLLYDWNSWLPCHMKYVVLHCSTFFTWNKIVRFRVRVPAKVHGWMARRPERLTGNDNTPLGWNVLKLT